MKKPVKYFIPVLLLAGIFFLAKTNTLYEEPESAFYSCRVTRVVDGDTICVKMDSSGEEVKVRFIGVNTPESVSADESENCAEGEAASDFTSGYLPAGRQVFLEFDEETEDRYGRTLAYVWLSADVDTDSYEDFCKYNYGAILIENTYCEAAYYAPNGRYREWYEKLDAEK